MQKFSKEYFSALRVDIDTALAAIGQKYEVNFSVGNIRYTEDAFITKLEATRKASESFDPKQAGWDSFASLFGLLPEHLGARVVIEEKAYTITGYRPSAKTKHINVQAEDGTLYAMDVETIKRGLGLVTKEAVEAKNQRTWETLAFMIGLKGVPYKQVFSHGGETFEAVELCPRAPKYPVIGRNTKTGKSYKFPADVLIPFKAKP